jgi:hypothetical protein
MITDSVVPENATAGDTPAHRCLRVLSHPLGTDSPTLANVLGSV